MNQQQEDNSHQGSQKIGKTMLYISWILALLMLTWFFSNYEKNRDNPNQDPLTASTKDFNEVTLKRNPSGHYMASGTINNKTVTFMLDTGATYISVPQKLAEDLKLEAMARGQSSTANGVVDVFLTRIKEVRIGNIVANDVMASINPGMNHSDYILLGMSVLKNVEFSQKGDVLVLRQAK